MGVRKQLASMQWTTLAIVVFVCVSSSSSHGQCKVLEKCSSDKDCGVGLYCFSCHKGFEGRRCVRSSVTDPFILLNGVRAFMLDTYDFKGDVWLCHSFGGKCLDITAFGPAIHTLREVEAFLAANPTEIVTLILEDYVKAKNGLTNVLTESGLMKYWFPLQNMPKNGQDWPLVSDMVANNHRLLVFTSKECKEKNEGIAYQWNYMVENQYGDGGMQQGNCQRRAESCLLDDKTKSLVLVNYFETIPKKQKICENNSEDLINMLHTCSTAAGNRWANFVAVDYYKRSKGGGSFQAVDTLNGKLLCGSDDIHACLQGLTSIASI